MVDLSVKSRAMQKERRKAGCLVFAMADSKVGGLVYVWVDLTAAGLAADLAGS